MSKANNRTASRGRTLLKAAAPLAALSLLLTACSGPADTASQGAGQAETGAATSLPLVDFGLQGLSGEQIVEKLEAQPIDQRPENLMASVRPTQLVLSDAAGAQAALDLPANKFYLSVAPYERQTHDCSFHSLTTCRGELRNVEVTVSFTGEDGKQILRNEKLKTNDNGFVGLWLPRDVTGELSISSGGQSTTQQVSTGSSDPTCLTTMQLS